MGDRLDEMQPVAVAAITFAPADRLGPHHRHLGLPFPLLADPDRRLYQRFGVGRAPWWRIYNPGTLVLYTRLVARGRRLHRATEDTAQLGADVVIDGQGRLVRLFRPRSPDDRPPVDDLIAALDRARHDPTP